MKLNKLYKIQEKNVEEDWTDPQINLAMLEETWKEAQEDIFTKEEIDWLILLVGASRMKNKLLEILMQKLIKLKNER
jgi:hypothetical protein